MGHHPEHPHGTTRAHGCRGRGCRGRSHRRGLGRAVRLAAAALLVGAVVKELRTPADERTWHGTIAGFVPYELRVPTPGRIKERLWSPDSARIVGPHVFGVGWSVNVGRLVRLVREQPTD